MHPQLFVPPSPPDLPADPFFEPAHESREAGCTVPRCKGVLFMPYPSVLFVRAALGHYLDLKPTDIDPNAELERDLGLEPLDLVLVVFRLEEFADVEFSISDLEGVVTVRDFEAVVAEWFRETSIDDGDEEPRPERPGVGSGTHVLGPAKRRAAR